MIGMTSAIFQYFEYIPLLKHLFIKLARTGDTIGFAGFRNLISTSTCLIVLRLLIYL